MVLEAGVLVVRTDNVVEGVALRGGEADLLAELIEIFVESDVEDVGTREITVAHFVKVVRRIPADGGQGAAAESPVERHGVLLALVVARLGTARAAVIERVVEDGRIRTQRRENLRVGEAGEGSHGSRALVVDLEAATFLVELAHLCLECRRQVRSDIERELSASAHVVAAGLAPTDGEILHEAICGKCAPGETTASTITERTGDRAFDCRLFQVEIVRARNVAIERRGRLRAGDVDRARDAVLAEEGGLRSAQQFNPLDIEQRRTRLLPATAIDAIDIGAGGLLESRIDPRADAADVNVVAEAAFLHREARKLRILQAHDAALGQLIAGDGVDRHRHALHRFFALVRGDDDLFE